MKKLILITVLFVGCKGDPYIIQQKCIELENPNFASYYYSKTGMDWIRSIDSANKFKIGDDIRK
jgi:hypothetical protein